MLDVHECVQTQANLTYLILTPDPQWTTRVYGVQPMYGHDNKLWSVNHASDGITEYAAQEQCRRANKGIEDISWVCESCSCIVDRANSTAVTDISRLTSLEVSVITDDLVEEMVADEARDQTYIITGTTEPSVF